MIKQVQKLLAPIKNRIMLAIARSIIQTLDDTKGIQTAQLDVLEDETRDTTERFQEYGFTSVPKPGAEAIIVRVGGNCDHGIIIACEDRRYRLKSLPAGEVALYTDEGDKIHLKRNRRIEIVASNRLTITSSDVRISGRLQVEGEIIAGGHIRDEYATNTRTLEAMRNIFNAHVHPENGTTTSAPSSTM